MGATIQLDFPELARTGRPLPEEFDQILNARVVGGADFDLYTVFELETDEAVRSAVVHSNAIAEYCIGQDKQGVIITAKSNDSGLDFVSRMFAPHHDIAEDPVTGSAHCCLAPYWSEKLGKTAMKAYQASARGGWLDVELKSPRVLLQGHAVTVMRCELQI